MSTSLPSRSMTQEGIQSSLDETLAMMRANIDKINDKPCILDYSPDHALQAKVTGLDPSGQSEICFTIYKPDSKNPVRAVQDTFFTATMRSFAIRKRSWIRLDVLRDTFLPVGWPGSVSSDYTRYQIFDSLQAFASTIAGLLSSRAVLSSIGVGSSSASPTSALLLHVAQDSTGRLATIFFAARFSAALEPETKRYRLLADIFNDISIVIDCASPIFPAGLVRGGLLATAGVLRALCGVAAGASKASLSVHFASGGDGSGSVAELNAKDASQETVISLLGSLVGTLVVSSVTSTAATWLVLLTLLGIHLAMNTLAVRAVCMRTLNRQRANLVLNSLMEGHGVRKPGEIGPQERIFERDGIVRGPAGKVLGWIKIGVGMEEIARSLVVRRKNPSPVPSSSGQEEEEEAKKQNKNAPAATALAAAALINPDTHSLGHLADLTALFRSEAYMLYPSTDRRTILISLAQTSKSQAQAQPQSQSQIPSHARMQLKGYFHALVLLHSFSTLPRDVLAALPHEQILQMISSTKEDAVDPRWDGDVALLMEKGWDLDAAALETRAGRRYSVEWS